MQEKDINGILVTERKTLINRLGVIDLIRRQIELLKLLSKQREYKPASFFSKSLDVSTKTIYTDITYLQSEVEKYKVDLVRAPRIGIRLEGENENI